MDKPFRVAVGADDAGDDWMIAWLGNDRDGQDYYIVTDHVHGSDLQSVSGGAKADAELVCKLLNEHYQKGTA